MEMSAVSTLSLFPPEAWGRCTYNSNEMMSLGEAETLSGLKVRSPLEPPTTTLITLGVSEDGVGSGEPGYDE